MAKKQVSPSDENSENNISICHFRYTILFRYGTWLLHLVLERHIIWCYTSDAWLEVGEMVVAFNLFAKSVAHQAESDGRSQKSDLMSVVTSKLESQIFQQELTD